MNIFTPSLFSLPAPCLPCCTPAAECACSLFIGSNMFVNPPTPFASYAAAAAVLADSYAMPGCLAYLNYFGSPTSSSVTPGANSLTMNIASGAFIETIMCSSVNVQNGDTLSCAYSGTASGGSPGVDEYSVGFYVYNCAGSLVYSDFSASVTSGTFNYSVTADDAYTVLVYFAGCVFLSCGWTASQAILSATTMTVNPAIAIWDDSGTTRQLWACPKLLLPPLTESTGTWYADATAAATAISTLTNSCKGYIESTTNVSSFSASGTTSLTLAATLTAGAMTSPSFWGGVNAESGETITSTITVGAGTAGQTVSIYDDTGTLVETSAVTTSPWTSAALPYTGRYTVKVEMTSSSNTTSMSAAISSSGTMSINPPQARYDVGLTCPATDDC